MSRTCPVSAEPIDRQRVASPGPVPPRRRARRTVRAAAALRCRGDTRRTSARRVPGGPGDASRRHRIERRVAADGRALPDVALAPGSHLFAEPGEVHEGVAEEGTEFLVFAGRDRQDAGGVGVVILLAQACLEVAQEAAVATASSIWLPAARQRLRGDVRLR